MKISCQLIAKEMNLGKRNICIEVILLSKKRKIGWSSNGMWRVTKCRSLKSKTKEEKKKNSYKDGLCETIS